MHAILDIRSQQLGVWTEWWSARSPKNTCPFILNFCTHAIYIHNTQTLCSHINPAYITRPAESNPKIDEPRSVPTITTHLGILSASVIGIKPWLSPGTR